MSDHVYMGIGVASFVDLAVSLPIYYDRADFTSLGKTDGGIGDLAVSLKLLYPPEEKKRVFHQAYYIRGTIPTGSRNAGIFPRHSFYESTFASEKYSQVPFYTSESGSLSPMLLWTIDIGNANEYVDLKFNINLGGEISFDRKKNNLIPIGLSLEYNPVDPLSIFVDYSYKVRTENFTNKLIWGSDPMKLSPGIRLNTTAGIYLTLAADLGLLSDARHERWKTDYLPVKGWQYETQVSPFWGFSAGFGWNGFLVKQDKDKDGFPDERDRCVNDAEDFDSFEDLDGCPDFDNDNDGVCDVWVKQKGETVKYASLCKGSDKCPLEPEDIDGFEDDDGCPAL